MIRGFEGNCIIRETSSFTEIRIAEGARISAPEGKTLTMTVDGVGIAMDAGAYKGDIVFTVARVLPGS